MKMNQILNFCYLMSLILWWMQAKIIIKSEIKSYNTRKQREVQVAGKAINNIIGIEIANNWRVLRRFSRKD